MYGEVAVKRRKVETTLVDRGMRFAAAAASSEPLPDSKVELSSWKRRNESGKERKRGEFS